MCRWKKNSGSLEYTGMTSPNTPSRWRRSTHTPRRSTAKVSTPSYGFLRSVKL